MKIKKYSLVFMTLLMPIFAFAQNTKKTIRDFRSIDSSSATKLVETLAGTINFWIIPLMVLLALAYFIFGAVLYIGENEDSKKEEKKQKMFWGLIALFVMLSVWSLVFVVANTFNIDTSSKNSSFYETLKN